MSPLWMEDDDGTCSNPPTISSSSSTTCAKGGGTAAAEDVRDAEFLFISNSTHDPKQNNHYSDKQADKQYEDLSG